MCGGGGGGGEGVDAAVETKFLLLSSFRANDYTDDFSDKNYSENFLTFASFRDNINSFSVCVLQGQ